MTKLGNDGVERFQQETREGKATLFRIGDWTTRFPWLNAGFSSRLGGIGAKPYDSLNCALHVGDDEQAAVENRRRLAGAAGFDFQQWTCAEQVHGCDVAAVGSKEAGAGRTRREDAIPSSDALVTDQAGIALTAFYADCVPLWFVDPVHRAVGLAHAGWRGAVADVAGATVRAMNESYGSKPEELFAAIGPSIRGCCYEVDDAVIHRVQAAGGVEGEAYTGGASPGRYMLDLSKFNKQKLIQAGILANHIEISGYCTSCRTDLFFSHRKENGRTGRMTAWIAKKEEVTSIQ